jgi:hypothetical protein
MRGEAASFSCVSLRLHPFRYVARNLGKSHELAGLAVSVR